MQRTYYVRELIFIHLLYCTRYIYNRNRRKTTILFSLVIVSKGENTSLCLAFFVIQDYDGKTFWALCIGLVL